MKFILTFIKEALGWSGSKPSKDIAYLLPPTLLSDDEARVKTGFAHNLRTWQDEQRNSCFPSPISVLNTVLASLLFVCNLLWRPILL